MRNFACRDNFCNFGVTPRRAVHARHASLTALRSSFRCMSWVVLVVATMPDSSDQVAIRVVAHVMSINSCWFTLLVVMLATDIVVRQCWLLINNTSEGDVFFVFTSKLVITFKYGCSSSSACWLAAFSCSLLYFLARLRMVRQLCSGC